jgi:hypothetical protein
MRPPCRSSGSLPSPICGIVSGESNVGARMRLGRSIAAALLAFQASHATAQGLTCTPPQKSMLEIELLLGRRGADEVRWRAFLAREVTPRFPDG